MSGTVGNWFALDNTAKIYPIITSEEKQSSFRIVAEITKIVDPNLLARSITDILPRFPSIKVKLKRGLFWYYFEENDATCSVAQDDGVILRHITNYDNNKYLFRVLFFDHQIILEFFHVLCDGNGAFEFMKTLLYQYLTLAGEKISLDDSVLDPNAPPSIAETEDSFETQYTGMRFRDINIKEFRGEKALAIQGTPFIKNGLGVIRAVIPADRFKALSKEFGCSVTVLLCGLFLKSIYDENIRKKVLKKPLLLFVPIDLRRYYKSKTLRNFVLYSRVGIRQSNNELELQDFIDAVKTELTHDTQPEEVQKLLNITVKMQHLALTRMMPLVVKNVVMKLGNYLMRANKHAAALSNMAITKVPADMLPFVNNIYAVMNCSKNLPLSCYVNTYNNKMNVVFSRSMIETDIIQRFFTFITSKDIPVELVSNYWEL